MIACCEGKNKTPNNQYAAGLPLSWSTSVGGWHTNKSRHLGIWKYEENILAAIAILFPSCGKHQTSDDCLLLTPVYIWSVSTRETGMDKYSHQGSAIPKVLFGNRYWINPYAFPTGGKEISQRCRSHSSTVPRLPLQSVLCLVCLQQNTSSGVPTPVIQTIKPISSNI